jgi:hypothetical protein
VYSGASKHFHPPSSAPDAAAAALSVDNNDDADQINKLAKDDPRLIGGNLQKEILLDLIDLRGRYLERENSANNSTQHNHMSSSLGTSFGRFKATFGERRFGAIHTRAAPRNIDRGEYAQLLYSCCFYLLEHAIDDSAAADDDHLHVKCNKNNKQFNLPNAIFAIFSLYTLHETNPLPNAPPMRQSTPRNKHGNLDEDALKEAWSALPMSREEGSLYRKSYKSPVRIDRRNYLLLLQLSDVCKAIIAQCCMNTDDSSPNNNEICQCSIAQDAVYIIYKMTFNQNNFFKYCEYHGPCGLEGLAGNPHFYTEHFVKQKIKKRKKSKLKQKGTSPIPATSLPLTLDELDEMKSASLPTILNLSALSDVINNHKSSINNLTAQLNTGGDLQPKQRDLVLNTLNGIINTKQAYFGVMSELKGSQEPIQAAIHNEVPKQPETLEGDLNNALPLVFPESFSSELRGNIVEALHDFGNEVTVIQSAVEKEIRAERTPKTSAIDANTSNIVLAGENNNAQSIGDILAFFDIESDHAIDDLEDIDEVKVEDEMSVATGAGRNALTTLLKLAEDDSVSSFDSKGEDEVVLDDISVATGGGMKALQNLLSQASGETNKRKRSPKPAKTKAAPSEIHQKRQKTKKKVRTAMDASEEIDVSGGDDFSVESTTAGKDALATLLSEVGSIEQV